MKIAVLLIVCALFQPPVITDFHTKKGTMGELFGIWRRQMDKREDNNFRWYIERCERGWNDPNDAPWYIRERVKEYFK